MSSARLDDYTRKLSTHRISNYIRMNNVATIPELADYMELPSLVISGLLSDLESHDPHFRRKMHNGRMHFYYTKDSQDDIESLLTKKYSVRMSQPEALKVLSAIRDRTVTELPLDDNEEFFKTDIDVIYFDMDGVLVDLIHRLAHLEGITVEELERRKAERKKENHEYDYVVHLIRKFLYTHECFATCLPMIHFQTFYSLIKHFLRKGKRVEILSSGTSGHDIFQEVCDQKREWLKKHGLDLLPQHFAMGAREKQKWAAPNALLIDDYEKNIRQFKEKGGHAIFYQNDMNKLMEELQELNLL